MRRASIRMAGAVALVWLAVSAPAAAEESPDRAPLDALEAQFQALRQAGKHDEAAQAGEKVVELARTLVGPDQPEYAAALSDLAGEYAAMGDSARAEPVWEAALVAGRRAFGPDDPRVAEAVDRLAALSVLAGRQDRAEALYAEAVEIRRRTVGESSAEFADRLVDLADLYRGRGDWAKAEPLYVQACDVLRQTRGEDHADYAACAEALAEVIWASGARDKAGPALETASAAARAAFGEDSPEYARALGNLAGLHFAAGAYEKAESAGAKALAIRDQVFGEDHPAAATLRIGLAAILSARGERDRAAPLYEKGVSVLRRAAGDGHPLVALGECDLAIRSARAGRLGPAQSGFAGGLLDAREFTVGGLGRIDVQGQAALLARAALALEAALSFIRQHPDAKDAVAAGAECLARWKGLPAEARTSEQRMARLAASPETRRLLGDLAMAREDLSRAALNPPASLKPDDIRRERTSAAKKVADLEARLALACPAFARLHRADEADLARIARALPPRSVLVDFVHFRQVDFAASPGVATSEPGKPAIGEWRYAAFITPAAEVPEPVMVDLGPAEPIDEAIADFRQTMERIEAGRRPAAEKDVREKLEAVGRLVLDPVRPHLKGARVLVVSPDGQLALVPFACLPIEGGRYLLETHEIVYLGAGRDAAALASSSAGPRRPTEPVLVGDPEFNLPPEACREELQKVKVPGAVAAFDGAKAPRDLDRVLFPPLPHTGPEVEAMAEALGGKAFLKKQALEGAVKQVAGPKVLVLATHGYFLADQREVPKDDPAAALVLAVPEMRFGDGLVFLAAPRPEAPPEDPLFCSGLAFAGANRRAAAAKDERGDDGILTAAEAAGLDLWGTRLVVLPVCQTGLGDVQQGDAVMNLRRAFLLAGAERVLGSLWLVPSPERRALETDFLARWQDGKPAARALREAQLAAIARLRSERGEADPFFWAAFTLAGDWR